MVKVKAGMNTPLRFSSLNPQSDPFFRPSRADPSAAGGWIFRWRDG